MQNPSLKLWSVSIYVLISIVSGCNRKEDCVTFFLNWDRLSRQEEAMTGLLYMGIRVDTTVTTGCGVSGGGLVGPGYGGYFSYEEGKVMMHDSTTDLPVPLFDFSMEEGDSLRVERKTDCYYASDSGRYQLRYWLILSWKKYDACLADTVFKFHHAYESCCLYGESGYPMDEIYFVSRKAGPLGWAEGKIEPYGTFLQYLGMGVGRLYFTENTLDSTETRRGVYRLIEEQNVYDCLDEP